MRYKNYIIYSIWALCVLFVGMGFQILYLLDFMGTMSAYVTGVIAIFAIAVGMLGIIGYELGLEDDTE